MKIKSNLNQSRLLAGLGDRLYFYKNIDSTMLEAKRMLQKDNLNDGDLLVAKSQTGGRGRRGRKWLSPKGGIWLSYIALPKLKREEYTLYSIMVAVSVHQCLKNWGINSEVKWPNDIIIENKKLAGIAIDLLTKESDYLVIGVGLNVYNKAIDIATRVIDYKADIDIDHFLISLVKEIDQHKIKLEENKQYILDKWRSVNNVIGKRVKIIPVNQEPAYLANAVDIDSKGSLIIEINNTERVVVAADVSLRVN